MKLKIIAIFLTLASVISFSSCNFSPNQSGSSESNTETKSSNTSWKYEDGTLTISGSGPMQDYTVEKISAKKYNSNVPWWNHRNEIKKVIVEDGVETIANNAFYECIILQEISLANSIQSIGSKAFLGCKLLSNFTLPEALSQIGTEAFSGCAKLSKLTIPNNVTRLESGVISNCKLLSEVTFPQSLKYIDESNFVGCNKLTKIKVPNGTEIAKTMSWTDGIKREISYTEGDTVVKTEILIVGPQSS